MQLKKFFAKDVKSAMTLVKKELGDDAFILANHPVPGGVEVVCAEDFDETSLKNWQSQHSQTVISKPRVKSATSQNNIPQQGETVTWIEQPTIVKIEKEMQSLRQLVESQLADLAWRDLKQLAPWQVILLKRCYRLGIAPELVYSLLTQAQSISLETDYEHLIQNFAKKLEVERCKVLTKGGILSLLGTSGTGKSTMALKLALKAAKKWGNEGVLLIACDDQQSVHHSTLRSYASLSHIAYQSIPLNQLNDKLKQLSKEFTVIIIDNPSIGQWSHKLKPYLYSLNSMSNISHYLVLSATHPLSHFNETLKAYSLINLKGVMLTKLDETTSLGEALSACVLHQQPIAFFTSSNDLKQDVEPMNTSILIKRLFGIAKQQPKKTNDFVLAQHYAKGLKKYG